MKWRDLRPEPAFLEALERVRERPPVEAAQDDKRLWSTDFANSCAVMFASELRSRRELSKLTVYPTEDGAQTEFLTGTRGRSRGKRVDVSVSSTSAGLQFALSLKGGNFRDKSTGRYGKNLTGRLYELLDEVRAIHEYHPHSLIDCVYFFPLEASTDGAKKSTLASAVATLRKCTGRDDPLLPTQFGRFDWTAIGLYVPEALDGGPSKGVCRFVDVFAAPPKRGRPKVEATMSLRDLTKHVCEMYRNDMESKIDYAEPEEE